MPLDPNTLRTGTQHLGAVDALKTAFNEPDAIDVSTDEDLLARDVRIQWADGSVIHGIYDKHAEMFAAFVSKTSSDMTNSKFWVGAWLGAVDAPWSENVAEQAAASTDDTTTGALADYDAAGTALIDAAIARGVPVVEHAMTPEEAYGMLLDRRVGELPDADLTAPMKWSEPFAFHEELQRIVAVCGSGEWTLTHRLHDVTHVTFTGLDTDGTFYNGLVDVAFAESLDEGRIVVEVLRADTKALPDWRDQMKAAGFSRTYTGVGPQDTLSEYWNDQRTTGQFTIRVQDMTRPCGHDRLQVTSTYHCRGSNSLHNVTGIEEAPSNVVEIGGVRMRPGLPGNVDVLKAGVAAAIAIRDARNARGGSFAMPLGCGD
jgi:hypothetical protein